MVAIKGAGQAIEEQLGEAVPVTTQTSIVAPPFISPLSQSYPSGGGSGVVSVYAMTSCGWTAVSNAAWIMVDSGQSGNGNAAVGYTVQSNNSPNLRTGTITIAGQIFTVTQSGIGYEADVAPRPNGSGTVVVSDWVQVGRFSVGLDTPTPGSEFQRADCAPRSAIGDGQITVADWVQAGRYSVGLDPVTTAGGPTQIDGAFAPLALLRRAPFQDLPRSLRILNHRMTPGQRSISVPVELAALGGENALSFTLEFDPATLRFDGYVAGCDTKVLIQPGQLAEGRVGIALALRPVIRLAAGTREVIRVRFKVLRSGAGVMDVNFVDGAIPLSLVSAEAEALPVQTGRSVPGREDSNWPSRLKK